MKILLFILLLLAAISAFSQDEALLAPRALFKSVPQNFAIHTLKVGVEFFNKSHTKSYCLFLSGRLDGHSDSQLFSYDDDFYKGMSGEFQYRKYLSGFKNQQTKRGKSYLQGIYIAGYLSGGSYLNKGKFSNTRYDYNTGQSIRTTLYVDESVINWGTGFTIGFHRTFWKVLFFDAYLGGGVQISEIERNYSPSIPTAYYYSSYNGIMTPGYQGIMPKFGVSLGVSL